MKKIIYMLSVMFLFTFILSACVSADALEEMENQIEDIEDEIDDIDDENKDLAEEIESMTVDRDEARLYNDELKDQTVKTLAIRSGEFSVTFDEYFAQLVYLSLEWNMDIIDAPQAVYMDDTNTINHPFTIPVYYDETCSTMEVHIESDSQTGRLLQCSVVILQDDENRGQGDAYTRAYKVLTELVLGALIMAQESPYERNTVTVDLLTKLQVNDRTACKDYNIWFEAYEEAEYEVRVFYPYE